MAIWDLGTGSTANALDTGGNFVDKVFSKWMDHETYKSELDYNLQIARMNGTTYGQQTQPWPTTSYASAPGGGNNNNNTMLMLGLGAVALLALK